MSNVERAVGPRDCRESLAACPNGPNRLPKQTLYLGLPETVEVAVRIDGCILAFLYAEVSLGASLGMRWRMMVLRLLAKAIHWM